VVMSTRPSAQRGHVGTARHTTVLQRSCRLRGATVRRSAKAPVPRGVFQEINCAGKAFGRLGHLGGHLAGSSEAMRGQNLAQVGDECFQGAFQKAPSEAYSQLFDHGCPGRLIFEPD
jgi:hypothetical protein